MWLLTFWDKFYSSYRVYTFKYEEDAIKNYHWLKDKRGDGISEVYVSLVVEHE